MRRRDAAAARDCPGRTPPHAASAPRHPARRARRAPATTRAARDARAATAGCREDARPALTPVQSRRRLDRPRPRHVAAAAATARDGPPAGRHAPSATTTTASTLRASFGPQPRHRVLREFEQARRELPRRRGVAQRMRALAVEPDVRAVRVQARPQPPLACRRANGADRRQVAQSTDAAERVLDDGAFQRELPGVGDVGERQAAALRVDCRARRDRAKPPRRRRRARTPRPCPSVPWPRAPAHPECRRSPGRCVHRAARAIDRRRPASPGSA